MPVLAALRDKKRKSKGSLPGKATAAGRVPKQSLRICDKEKKNETKGRVISATTTKLVNRIWGEFYSNYLPEKSEGGRGFKVNEDEETGNEDEEIENEEDEVENTQENMEESSEVEDFSLKGAEYSVKDFAYLRPHYFAADSKAMDTSKSRKNTRLKPFVVCHLLEIKLSKSYKLADPESTKVKVRRFFRRDDISPEKAHLSDVREVRTYFCLCKELLFQES